jgi:hypothetical protein
MNGSPATARSSVYALIFRYKDGAPANVLTKITMSAGLDHRLFISSPLSLVRSRGTV